MMDFGGAIAAVKAGHKVARDAWRTSHPGWHIRLRGIDFVVMVDAAKVGGYCAPPVDLLAEDWNWVPLPDTAAEEDAPTIPEENIENDNVEFVDTASADPAPVASAQERPPHDFGGIAVPHADD